ncbi:DNA polymerase/3'-5' exonuclease PolX [Salibacterium salarium]|uniref:DNA polymerase/3'-5' exonuclease PolX n=1 Tax=Salibacterium salarium TaxID=284579 RepID=A0A3R9QLG4_9BACI|nr:DNA polymerase/3'-5' exonuclease PolX [Salibacterium salarium]RSL32995.1 DNA polymerase/3'-5' exonuclease PolX [Salibacterium salarium]
MNKKELIKSLELIAVYMELKGENPFKISAYRKAAQALEQDERSLSEMEDPAKLTGIGKGTAAVVEELRETNRSELLETLKEEVPSGLVPLLDLPGLGGKKLAKLYQELGVHDAASLKKECHAGNVQKLAGFGVKTEEKIISALEDMGNRPERLPIHFMLEAAKVVEQQIEEHVEIDRYARAGSLRRMEETIKDLDYIMVVEDPDTARKQLKQLDLVSDVIADGQAKVSLELSFTYPVQVDVRLVEEKAFATTLHHFTGSKDHNVLIRQMAKAQGEKVSEYGVEDLETGDVTTFSSEEAFFSHFGLHYIPPEARLGRDETEQYKEPFETIVRNDIRGDLHMHTTWSDGALSIEEMALEARSRGHEWIAITDHSKFLQVAHGLNEERVLRQIEEIKRVNEKYNDIEILAGIEMDIRPDGTLDLDEDVLKRLDLVIASIHSSFSQTEAEIMHRMKAALYSPYVNIIAHPTGRLIGRREGYKVDVEFLLQEAAATGTALELNSNPNRLDLSAEWLRKTSEIGTMITINTDAHSPDMLNHMDIGAGIARKALLQKGQIINTRSYASLLSFLQEKRRIETE